MNPFRLLALLVLFGFSAPGVEPGRQFLITGPGAVADGQALNTEAIQKTIDAAAAAGGGTVIIPPGEFLSGANRHYKIGYIKGHHFLQTCERAGLPSGVRARI